MTVWENASLGDIAIRWDESEIYGERSYEPHRIGCVTAFFPSHILRIHFAERRRDAKRTAEKKGEREREREMKTIARICPSVWFRWPAKLQHERRELSFHSVMRLGSDRTKRSNSLPSGDRRCHPLLPLRLSCTLCILCFSATTAMFHSGRKTRKNWLPELAAVIVAAAAVAPVIYFHFGPWKSVSRNYAALHNIFLDARA